MELVRSKKSRTHRRRRVVLLIVMLLVAGGWTLYQSLTTKQPADHASTIGLNQRLAATQMPASQALDKLAVKGRAPKTGYSRKQFGDGWAQVANCTVRDKIMARDFAQVSYVSPTDCSVQGGILNDPYTGNMITFTRLRSSIVQIDHVVALSNAWQTGAQQLTAERRVELANDPLELLAVDGPANNQKGDADAATWLPANKDYRCRYIARQIAVKLKYNLWVTPPEKEAMRRVLGTCPQQVLPVEQPVQSQS